MIVGGVNFVSLRDRVGIVGWVIAGGCIVLISGEDGGECGGVYCIVG